MLNFSLHVVDGTELNTWEINFVRFGFAGLCMILLSVVSIFYAFYDRKRSSPRNISALSDLQDRTPRDEAVVRTDIESASWYCLPSSAEMGPSDWLRIVIGVLFVTLLCPALSNYAVFKLDLGVSLTLNSLGPLYSLPVSILFAYFRKQTDLPIKDKVTWRAAFGTGLTFIGVVILCT